MTLSDFALEPADIVLVRDLGAVSRWIRAVQTLRSGEAYVSHAALAVGGQHLIESGWRVKFSDSSRYDQSQCVVWRHRWLTTAERSRIVGAASAQAGAWYGVLKLPLFAADAVAASIAAALGKQWDDWFCTRLGVTRWKVCSQFVAWAYESGLQHPRMFGVDWRRISPDAIDDWCLAHPSDWEEVFCGLRLRGRLEA